MHLNPYIAGNPIRTHTGFFGRDDILRDITQVLRDPQSNAIVLFGQRRIGKTSILLEIERRLRSKTDYTPIYFDLQDKASKPLSDVLDELAQRIAKATNLTPEWERFDTNGEYFRDTFLPIAADAAHTGGLALLFDEFDVLDSSVGGQAGQSFFPYLRAWMSEVQRVHFIFIIGRRPEDLSIETISTFKGVRALRISLLDREAVEAVVRQSERDGSLFWTDEASERVWYWTKGHAYLTQLLCHVIWENANDPELSNPGKCIPESVDGAVDEALQQGANAFHWIWGGLPPAERVIMAAMAEAGDTVITQEYMVEILNRSGVRLIVRELELAPETLVDWELLSSVNNGYRFVIPMLRQWVARNRPLRRVKEELDRLEPLAENLFQTGRQLYNLGRSSDAQDQLQHSLRINPNHLKSRLLLGRILLEDNQAADAINILEEAYRYDEGAARADLTRALLAVVTDQDGDLALATCERILNIDSRQPMALERKSAIWNKRGEDALAQDDLEAALAAFQNADAVLMVERVTRLISSKEIDTEVQNAKKSEAAGKWEDAIAIYRELSSKYPDADEWNSRLKEVRVEAANWFANKDRWPQAIEIYESLAMDFPAESDWLTKLEAGRIQASLKEEYDAALFALTDGNSDAASAVLAKLIVRQPTYREAARYLLIATTGVDTEELTEQLRIARKRISVLESTLNSDESVAILNDSIRELRLENTQLFEEAQTANSNLRKAEEELDRNRGLKDELRAANETIELMSSSDTDGTKGIVAQLLAELEATKRQVVDLEMALNKAYDDDWRSRKKTAY